MFINRHDALSTGGQQLLEAYARLQQLRGLPATIPANSSPALQQISKASDIAVPVHLDDQHLSWWFLQAQLCVGSQHT